LARRYAPGEVERHERRGWLAAATDRVILGRSIVMCLVVGAILTAINHGDQLIRGEFDSAMAWKVGLTFVVPFLVATISGAAAIHSRDRDRHEPGDDPASGQPLDSRLDSQDPSDGRL
jgi:hypothetical protein